MSMNLDMAAYYNEFDPKAAAWLRELIHEGLITPGFVDERPIQEVRPADLVGYERVHFFAGIAGWELALNLAGWQGSVWTGSCPCQPFSSAGKRKGEADERHVWPEWFRLVRECRPGVVFGEQVEGAVRLGWLDGVFADLEGEGYACGAVVLGAHSVGAPHIRQRIFWVADAECDGVRPHGPGGTGDQTTEVPGEVRQQRVRPDAGTGVGPVAGRLADADGGRGGSQLPGQPREESDTHGHGERPGRLGNPVGDRPQGVNCPRRWPGTVDGTRHAGWLGDSDGTRESAVGGVSAGAGTERPGGAGFWSAFDLIPCRDGKTRRTKPGLFPLAPGLPGRVGLLRGAGNAIVPQVAAEFVQAYLEARADLT